MAYESPIFDHDKCDYDPCEYHINVQRRGKITKVIRHKDGYRTFIFQNGEKVKQKPIAIWSL